MTSDYRDESLVHWRTSSVAHTPVLTPYKDNDIIVFVIPVCDDVSGNLPPGIHEATWSELLLRYGSTPQRLRLLAGLRAALDSLRAAGCTRVYLDGSFVTVKADPGDFDACWEMAGVDFTRLDQEAPILLDWSRRRAGQKAAFGGELFIADSSADPWGTPYLEFFERDRTSGQPKGIIALTLGDLS